MKLGSNIGVTGFSLSFSCVSTMKSIVSFATFLNSFRSFVWSRPHLCWLLLIDDVMGKLLLFINGFVKSLFSLVVVMLDLRRLSVELVLELVFVS